MNLLETTNALLRRALKKGLSLKDLAPEDGPVEYEWLKKFSSGKVKDPSVNRIQALHDQLVDRGLS